MSLSAAFHDIILAHFFNEAAHGVVGPMKLRLHTASPGTTGANEVDTGDWTNYAEEEIDTDLSTSPHFSAPGAGTGSNRKVSNVQAVSFGTATIVSPVTVTHVSLWDSSGTPKFIAASPLTVNKTINNGDPVSFEPGEVVIELGPPA